jgi:putative oxidoreductase
MDALAGLYYKIHDGVFSVLKYLDGLPPLAMRVFLAYPFWYAGKQKLDGIDNTIAWFGNADWGLGLPFPEVLAYLAAYTEFIGAWLLLIGLATRWISIPLMVTMLVAIVAVHWDNGWFAIAQSADSEVALRLGAARDILQEHGNYSWLTAKGSFVILQNGIEFAVTYLIMLFALCFTGGGRYVSADYYLSQLFPRNQ